jgi:hypothetical protein
MTMVNDYGHTLGFLEAEIKAHVLDFANRIYHIEQI